MRISLHLVAIIANMVLLLPSRTAAFGVVRRQVNLFLPVMISTEQACLSSPNHYSPTHNFESVTTRLYQSVAAASVFDIKSIDWVQDAVLEAITELYDPAEVARGAAMAKLNKRKKPKKKERQESDSENLVLSEVEKQAIADQAAANAKPFSIADTMVTLATKPEFGDYQVNAAMGLAKSVGMNPRECASQIVQKIMPTICDYMEDPEIAGPGFINLRFKEKYLTSAAFQMAGDSTGRLGLPGTRRQQKIVVDFSSPNIAKEMHVGHLRSTIIGDSLCNLLEFSGHDVIRLNHVGDWGTQFGMLVEHLRDEYPEALSKDTAKDVELGDLVELYKAAKRRFDVDEEFKLRAREGVVRLQAGNEEAIAAWDTLCSASRLEYQKIYDLLNIRDLTERGESFYNPYLNDVITELEKQGLAVKSEGATVVFLDGYTNRDGTALPMLIRKSDGGFNYATTDMAAIRHRVQMEVEESGERADRVLYVTDAGQSQHFAMVFAAAKLADFVPDHATLEHVPFGLVQGEDGKKFATRSGDTVKLKDLLNEAIRIAAEDLRSRPENQDLDEERINKVAKIVGIGAVKYADLSMNRESNYRFSYERMLSLNGNTAPYMLYAYARICGIVRKSTNQEKGTSIEWPKACEILITEKAELELIRNLVKLPDILLEVEQDLYPHKMCDYLFETSQKFNKFYETCPVNNAETAEIKTSRLSLCTATAGTIRLLMNTLGIELVEQL